MSAARFADRRDAGRALAQAVREAASGWSGTPVVVLGLPRGGVVVADEVAAALDAPLDVVVVRKLGHPEQPELALGALAAVGEAVETVRAERVLGQAGIDEATFDAVRDRELAELRRRASTYRVGGSSPALTGRVVVLVDDGLATGSTMRAAVAAVRGQHPDRVVVAVPVAAPRAVDALEAVADEVISLSAPRWFRAVGQAYEDFAQTEDEEVDEVLRRSRERTREVP